MPHPPPDASTSLEGIEEKKIVWLGQHFTKIANISTKIAIYQRRQPPYTPKNKDGQIPAFEEL